MTAEISLHPTGCSLFATLWLENPIKSFLYTEVAHIDRKKVVRWSKNVGYLMSSTGDSLKLSHYWGSATSLYRQRLMFCCTARHAHSGQIVWDFMVAHCDRITEMSFFLNCFNVSTMKGMLLFFFSTYVLCMSRCSLIIKCKQLILWHRRFIMSSYLEELDTELVVWLSWQDHISHKHQ